MDRYQGRDSGIANQNVSDGLEDGPRQNSAPGHAEANSEVQINKDGPVPPPEYTYPHRSRLVHLDDVKPDGAEEGGDKVGSNREHGQREEPRGRTQHK